MQFTLGAGLDIVTSVAALVLAALGLYVIYGLMRVINMAHGELLMFGAYTASIVQTQGLPFWLAVTTSTLIVAFLGLILEWLVIRRLYDKGNLSTLLATWGISLCLIESVRLIFGPAGRFVDSPTSRVLMVAGVTPYPIYSLILVFITIVVCLMIWVIFRWTKVGILVRATMEDAPRAESCGINTRRVHQFTFASGCALAGFAGALLAPISSVTPYMGLDYGPRSFLVVILGGSSGSLFAPVAGSLIVAGVRSLFNSFFGITTATLGMLVVALIALFLRPKGILERP